MRILLINPKFYYLKYSRLYNTLPFYVNIKFPPLGLAYIGAVLEKSKNEVSILDANALNLGIDEIINHAKNFHPDMVGITCQISSLNACLHIGKLLKKELPHIKLVLGGPVFIIKSMVKKALKNPFVDFVVIGEGEETIVELVDSLKNGSGLSSINGIGYKKDKKIIFTRPRQLIKNLDSLPFPAFHLLPANEYKLNNYTFSSILSSRGCVFDCKFCGQKFLWGRKIRFRSSKNIVDEIEYLYNNFKIRWFKFADDIFTFDKSHTKDICKKIIERNLKIKWMCQTRTDTISDELLKLMKKSGCASICYGVESGSQKTLQYIGKETSLISIKKTFWLTRKNGIYPQSTFIIGFPHEGEKEIQKTVEFGKSLRAVNYGLLILFPIPKTPLYNEIKKKKLFSEPLIKTQFLSSKDLIMIANRYHTILMITGLFNLFINTLDRTIENPSEIFEVFKEFGHMFFS